MVFDAVDGFFYRKDDHVDVFSSLIREFAFVISFEDCYFKLN